MSHRLQLLAFVPGITGLLFLVAHVIQTPYSESPSNTIFIAVITLLMGITGWVLYRSKLNWRILMFVLSVPLILSGLIGYATLGTYAGALVALWGGLAYAMQSIGGRLQWFMSSLVFLVIVIITLQTHDTPIPFIIHDALSEFIRSKQHFWFLVISYLTGIVIMVYLHMPIAKTIEQLVSETLDKRKIAQDQRNDATAGANIILNNIPVFLIELDPQGHIINTSGIAKQLIQGPSDDNRHYAASPLATIKILPHLLDLARMTGGQFSSPMSENAFSSQFSSLVVTPFKKSEDEPFYFTLTMTRDKETISLTEQFLAQYLGSLDSTSGIVSFVSCRFPLDTDTDTDTQNFYRISNQTTILIQTIEQTKPTTLRFLQWSYNRLELVVSHSTHIEHHHFIDTLGALCSSSELSSAPITAALVAEPVELLPNETFVTRCLTAQHGVANQAWAAELILEPNDTITMNKIEREALKQEFKSEEIKLYAIPTERRDPELTLLHEIKLLRSTKPLETQQSEDVLEEVERNYLSRYLSAIEQTELVHVLQTTLNTHPESRLGLRIPGSLDIRTFLHNLDALLKTLNICPDRLWLRINEDQLSKSDSGLWEELNHFHTLGFQFMLGEVGEGDTDLALIANPLFSMVHFARTTISTAMTSKTADIVLRHVVNISKELQLSTMAKAPKNQTTKDYLYTLGIDYIDTA